MDLTMIERQLRELSTLPARPTPPARELQDRSRRRRTRRRVAVSTASVVVVAGAVIGAVLVRDDHPPAPVVTGPDVSTTVTTPVTTAPVAPTAVLPDPPAEVECPASAHPREPGSLDGLPQPGGVDRTNVEQVLATSRTDLEARQPGASAHLARWDRWTWTDVTGTPTALQVTGYQIVLVVPTADDCTAAAPSFHNGAPVTTVFGPLTAWADAPQSEAPTIGPLLAEASVGLVADLLERLADDDLDGAAALWRYTDWFSDLDAAVADLQRVVAEHPGLVTSTPTLSVTPSFAFAGSPAWPVVTAVSAPGQGGARQAAAFLLSYDIEGLELIRLPELPDITPAPGSAVGPGDVIVRPGVPVEGGATAHINGVAVPTVVDHDALTTSFTVPDWATGDIVVTMSVATPEAPAQSAFWYRVR